MQMFGISNDCGEYIMNCGALGANQHAEKMGRWHLVTNEGVQRVWMGGVLKQDLVMLQLWK